MSGTRNKRKRPENDTSTSATPSSRRRSRDNRALTDDGDTKNKNNEEKDNTTNHTSQADAPGDNSAPNTSEDPSESKTPHKTTSINSNDNQGNKSGNNANAAKDGDLPSADVGSGSREDKASGTKRALHESNDLSSERSTKKPSLKTNDTESRLRGLIEHRAILLERIRLCRSAAEKRLGGIQTSNLPPGNEKMINDDEIVAYREMMKHVAQAAKKSRSEGEGQQAEKRTSLSLRRGSSVGKRMNAALSSLAPGSNATAPDSPGAPPVAVGPTPQMTTGGKSSSAVSVGPRIDANLIAPVGNRPQNVSPRPPPIGPSANVMKAPPTQAQSSFSQPIPTPSELQRSRVPNSKNFKSTPAAQSRPAILSRDPMSIPQHLGVVNTSVLPPNRLLPTRVVYPEAIALRERRQAIQAKLSAFLERQERELERSESIDLTARKQRGQRKLNVLETRGSTQLPFRLKTHWDVVLKEMKWLATDFIEERKHKISAARSTATMILSQTLPGSVILPSNSSKRKKDEKGAIAAARDESKHNQVLNERKESGQKPSKSLAVETQQSGRRVYPDPASEDILRTRKIAGMLSSAVIDQISGNKENTGSALFDNSLGNSKLDLRTGINIANKIGVSGAVSELIVETQEAKPDYFNADNASKILVNGSPKEFSYGEITEFVGHKTQFKDKAKSTKANTDLVGATTSSDIKLSTEQRNFFDFVNQIWGVKKGPGAILSGPPASGKTFAICATIWKQKTNGIQLLLCPPTSFIRWKQELNRFTGLRVATLNLSGVTSSPDNVICDFPDLGPGDIVLCEHGLLQRLTKFVREEQIELFSVVVDCRNNAPLFVSESTPSTKSEDDEPSSHLDSTNWWEDLATISIRIPRRLLVEFPQPEHPTNSSDSPRVRQQLELLALRTAFLIGTEVFSSPTLPLKRRVISWARQKGKKGTADKVTRIRTVLTQVLQPMYMRVSREFGSSDFKWSLRWCSMPPEQRLAYDESCFQVRGSLSSSLVEIDKKGNPRFYSFDLISKALLRLRLNCFHGNVAQLLSEANSRIRLGPVSGAIDASTSETTTKHGASRLSRRLVDSAAQPDLDLSVQIIQSSSKLKELISILATECGYELPEHDSFKGLLDSIDKVRSKPSSKSTERKSTKRVAILAVLPEVQLVVSVLLNALGIRHNLLLREALSNSAVSEKNSDLKRTAKSAIAWTEQQMMLSAFNSVDQQESGLEKPATVIVGSPYEITAWNGLGVDMADLIVSLDEDWTGRGGDALNSLVARWHARKVQVGESSELIRLACPSTIEENLLLDSGSEKETEPMNWPIDTSGCFEMPLLSTASYNELKQNSRLTTHGFPATTLMKLRGSLLSDVLKPSKPIPPRFPDGMTPHFLPPLESGTDFDTQGEIAFLRCYVRSEYSASLQGNECRWIELSAGCTKRPVQSAPTCLHFDGRKNFPDGLVSRQDAPFLSTRLYMEERSQWTVCTPNIPGLAALPQVPDSTLAGAGGTAELLGKTVRDICESLTVSGLNSKPDVKVDSLLFYHGSKEEATSSEHVQGVKSPIPNSSVEQKLRVNLYSRLYASRFQGTVLHDGNQGIEAFPYFPPLFPDYGQSPGVEGSPVDKPPENVLPAESSSVSASVEPEINKRKEELQSISAPIIKRARLEDDQSTTLLSDVQDIIPVAAAPLNLAASIVGSVDPLTQPQELVGTVTTSAGTSAMAEDESMERIESSNEVEDFGLLGRWNVSASQGASLLTSCDNGECGDFMQVTSGGSQDFNPYSFPCDAEEAGRERGNEGDLESIILFVRKRQQHGFPSFSEGNGTVLRTAVPGLERPPVGTSAIMTNNGDDLSKKIKKKPSQSSLNTATSAVATVAQFPAPDHSQTVSTTPSNAMLFGNAKDAYRQRVLSFFVSRYYGTGLSMFESTAYRAASVRVRDRVVKRLSYEVGPGLPQMAGERRLPSFATQLKKGSETGEMARSTALSQRSSLKRSLVSPCRVDFGPFGGGYFASPSGTTGISPPRSRLGVSLPMGVKVPQATREQTQPAWSAEEDQLLRDFAVRFGMNWLLVARAVSGFENVVFESKKLSSSSRKSPPRSVRQCRGRWQSLAKKQPSIAIEVRQSERILRENALVRPAMISMKGIQATRIDGQNNRLPNTLLSGKNVVPGAMENGFRVKGSTASDSDTSKPVAKEAPLGPSIHDSPDSSTTLSAVSKAKALRQFIPLTIPGIPPGSDANQPVPSHPSHMQSVQASVAAQWSSGRTEMWPLQILDCADKQRAAARAPTSTASRTGESSKKSSASSTSSSRRQPTGSTSPVPQVQRAPSSVPRTGTYPGSSASSVRSTSKKSGNSPHAKPPPSSSQRSATAKSAATTNTDGQARSNQSKSKP